MLTDLATWAPWIITGSIALSVVVAAIVHRKKLLGIYLETKEIEERSRRDELQF